jgi:hypothetical protein
MQLTFFGFFSQKGFYFIQRCFICMANLGFYNVGGRYSIEHEHAVRDSELISSLICISSTHLIYNFIHAIIIIMNGIALIVGRICHCSQQRQRFG